MYINSITYKEEWTKGYDILYDNCFKIFEPRDKIIFYTKNLANFPPISDIPYLLRQYCYDIIDNTLEIKENSIYIDIYKDTENFPIVKINDLRIRFYGIPFKIPRHGKLVYYREKTGFRTLNSITIEFKNNFFLNFFAIVNSVNKYLVLYREVIEEIEKKVAPGELFFFSRKKIKGFRNIPWVNEYIVILK